jgi:hypothetical protein
VTTGGGKVLTTMSQPMARRCMHDPVLGSLPGRCPSRPGAIDPRNTRPSDGSRSKGLGGRRAPRSCSINPHTIAVRRFLSLGPYAPRPSQGLRLCSTALARRRSRRRRRAIAAASASSRRYVSRCSGGMTRLTQAPSCGVSEGNLRVGPTTPTRARRLADASVDPTDARNGQRFWRSEHLHRRAKTLVVEACGAGG